MTSIKEHITNITNSAIKKCGYPEIPVQLFQSKHADCTTNVAFLIAKELKLNPKDVAKNIIDKINETT